jgi:hypothetical protein
MTGSLYSPQLALCRQVSISCNHTHTSRASIQLPLPGLLCALPLPVSFAGQSRCCRASGAVRLAAAMTAPARQGQNLALLCLLICGITHSTCTTTPASLRCHHLHTQLQCRRRSSHASPPPDAGLHHHWEGWATCMTAHPYVSAASCLLGKPGHSRRTAVRLQHTPSHHVRDQAADLAVCTRNTATRSACDGKPK